MEHSLKAEKTSTGLHAGPAFEALRAPTRRERFLSEMEHALPWRELGELVEPVYRSVYSRQTRPLELDRLLRIYFLQRWFHLSDAAVREELYDSAAMRRFACVGLGRDAVPTETTVFRFRSLLDQYGLGEAITAAAERHLRSHGLAVSSGAIVHATLTRFATGY